MTSQAKGHHLSKTQPKKKGVDRFTPTSKAFKSLPNSIPEQEKKIQKGKRGRKAPTALCSFRNTLCEPLSRGKSAGQRQAPTVTRKARAVDQVRKKESDLAAGSRDELDPKAHKGMLG